jgi:hypothetical protein
VTTGWCAERVEVGGDVAASSTPAVHAADAAGREHLDAGPGASATLAETS